ncbi:CBS domain-containing protein [bacterium]|nr:CBS domain-containing protein [bacterium]
MFRKRVRLFTLHGFDVSLDPSWLLLALLVAWSLSTGFFPYRFGDLSTTAYWAMGIAGALGLFLSIVIHEFSHSVLARRSGMTMKGITLFIFGGAAEMTDEPPRPRAEFLIAIVGPLASLALAAVLLGVHAIGVAGGWPRSVNGVVEYLVAINVIVAVFNLVPAYPLDGGRVLRAALWAWKGNLRWATRIAARIGWGFGALLMALGVLRILAGSLLGGIWMVLIGLFVQRAADMSYQQLVVRRALEGEPVRRFMNSDPVSVSPETAVERMVEDVFYRHHVETCPVTVDGRLIGCVTRDRLKDLDRDDWGRTTAADVMEDCAEANHVSPDTDSVDAMARMRQHGLDRLIVVGDGQYLGTVTLKNMLEFLATRMDLEPERV